MNPEPKAPKLSINQRNMISLFAVLMFGREPDGIHCVACSKPAGKLEGTAKIEFGVSGLCKSCQNEAYSQMPDFRPGIYPNLPEDEPNA